MAGWGEAGDGTPRRRGTPDRRPPHLKRRRRCAFARAEHGDVQVRVTSSVCQANRGSSVVTSHAIVILTIAAVAKRILSLDTSFVSFEAVQPGGLRRTGSITGSF
jgi:hypothetical protein